MYRDDRVGRKGAIGLDKQRSEPMFDRNLTNLIHFFNRDVVAPPREVGVPLFKFEEHRLGKTGKELAGWNIHVDDLHNAPVDIQGMLDNPSVQDANTRSLHLGCQVFGIATVDEQTGLLQGHGVDFHAFRHTGNPNNDVCLR